MTGADIPKVDAQKKALTYTKAVFQRIHEVKTSSLDTGVGDMIYGMLLSTEMLEEDKILGWIHHLDVSDAQVMASFRRKGGRIAQVKTSIKTLETKAGATAEKFKKLKDTNPDLKW